MRQGFSLVELSIVLVILGLLTGGILAGQSLIRASELRAVSSEIQRYQAAVSTFRDKYFGLPGDITIATKFWGAAHATPATCLTTVGTGTQTCNGDGDGIIDSPAAGNQYGEMFTFWQQLGHAGLVEGSYTGIAGNTGAENDITPGTNVPRSKLSNAVWSVYNYGSSGNTVMYDYDYGNMALFGADVAGTTGWNPVFKPEEAWNIDVKMDDGRPAYGSVIALFWNNLCAAADDGTHAANDLNASYRLSNSAVACSITFKKAF